MRTTRSRRSAALSFGLIFALIIALMAPLGVSAAPKHAHRPSATIVSPDQNDARIPLDAGTLGSLSVQAVTAASGDYRIDALLSGYSLPGTTVTYSFYSDAVFGGAYYGSEVNVHEPSEAVKNNARAALAWYGSIMNVNFVEVTETPTTIGYIRVMDSDSPSYAYCYYPAGSAMFSLSGDVHLNSAYDRLGDTNGFQHPAGQHGYMSIVHELGHALGLKHPFEGTNVLPTAEDNTSNTLMTYTFLGNSSATPMVYDVMALQYMYGARAKNTGDDTYAFTSRGTSQYTLGSDTWQVTPYQTKQTIWDSAGVDTLDASALPSTNSGYKFDLRGGGWLIGTAQDSGNWFAYGSSLAASFAPEKFVNSSSSDAIIANSSANTFGGYAAGRAVGNDTITGATAEDLVDLSGYNTADVSASSAGSDLLLTLGANGSVKVIGYFSGNAPAILYADGGSLPNLAPTAAITASPTNGTAPLAVSFSGAGSSDSDGSIVSYAWNFGDGATASGITASHAYASAGTYTASLTVTDDRGATASSTKTITVTAPAKKVHVGSIALSVVATAKGKAVRSVVTMVDAAGAPVASVTVGGKFSGVVSSNVTGKTGATGQVTYTSPAVKTSGNVTFTITKVTAPTGWIYDAAANTGTSATIAVVK